MKLIIRFAGYCKNYWNSKPSVSFLLLFYIYIYLYMYIIIIYILFLNNNRAGQVSHGECCGNGCERTSGFNYTTGISETQIIWVDYLPSGITW